VAAAPGDQVDRVGRDLALAAAEAGGDVLLESTSGRRERVAGGRLGEPAGRPRRAAEAADLAIVCTDPPANDPRVVLRARSASAAVVVLTRGRTGFDAARQTADLLRLAGIEVAAAVLKLDARPVPAWARLRQRLGRQTAPASS
jgi:hypothetical protein